MYYVYILESSKNGRYYVGTTNNIIRRVKQHNSGNVRSTAPYVPWKLKKTEEFVDISSAYKRERFIKAKHSRKIIEKIVSG